jgi:hypothetical protein
MSRRRSLARRLAEALVRAAARAAPPDRSEWGTAMLAEMDHVPGDGQALVWAAGCLIAALRLQLQVAEFGRGPAARALLALLIAVQVARALFAPAMVLSWRLGATGVTAALGGQTAGDDYRRFIPLMQAAPHSMLAAALASAVLFMFAAVTIRRGRSTALVLFLIALGLDMASTVLGDLSPQMRAARAAAFAFPDHNLRRDVLVPIAGVLYPVALTLGLWWVSGPRRQAR